jgi:hypothetical protein
VPCTKHYEEYQIKNDMGTARGTFAREGKFLQGFGEET